MILRIFEMLVPGSRASCWRWMRRSRSRISGGDLVVSQGKRAKLYVLTSYSFRGWLWRLVQGSMDRGSDGGIAIRGLKIAGELECNMGDCS